MSEENGNFGKRVSFVEFMESRAPCLRIVDQSGPSSCVDPNPCCFCGEKKRIVCALASQLGRRRKEQKLFCEKKQWSMKVKLIYGCTFSQLDDSVAKCLSSITCPPFLCAICPHCKYVNDSWSLSHLGYLYPGTPLVVIKLVHNRSCPWV